MFNSDTHLKQVTNVNMERTSETALWKQEPKRPATCSHIQYTFVSQIKSIVQGHHYFSNSIVPEILSSTFFSFLTLKTRYCLRLFLLKCKNVILVVSLTRQK